MSDEHQYDNWGAFGSAPKVIAQEARNQYPTGSDATVWDLKIVIGKITVETAATDTPEQISTAMRTADDLDARNARIEAGRRHKLDGKRDAMTAMIERAMRESTDHEDVQNIWAVLLDLAQRVDPVPPLLGVTEDGSFIRYRSSGNRVALFSVKMLRGRLVRHFEAQKGSQRLA